MREIEEIQSSESSSLPTPAAGPVLRNRSVGARTETSRDEMNLAEFPLAVLSTRNTASVKTLEFKDYTRLPSGEVVERKWIITGADKFGLPTSTDDDVILGLIRMTMDQGFRERKVFFTRYELLKTLRWTTEGRSYSRLIKSLDRLSGVRIRSTNSFYDNTTKSYQTCNFGIIDAYEINNERIKAGGEEPRKSFFIWSEVLFDSFKAGFIKKLDLQLYFSLNSSISRRLYRYLDKHFYYKSTIEMPLFVLAFEKIGLSRSYKYISSIKQQLEPAARELVEAGFLAGYEFRGRGASTTVRFQANSSGVVAKVDEAKAETKAAPKAVARTRSGDGSLLTALLDRGIAEPQAKKLLAERPDAELQQVKEIISYYDFLVQKGDMRVSRNPTGFLYRAVQSPYRFKVPPSFKRAQGSRERGEHAGLTVRTNGRPELKVFRASHTPGRGGSANERPSEYAALEQLSVAERASVIQRVEAKMKYLKGVLSGSTYSEVFASCLKEELGLRRVNSAAGSN